MDPLVSIIAPCYNGEKYISTFLDSVLAQEYGNIELILVDDGSVDNTGEIVRSYEPKFRERRFRLEYLYQENAGQAAAINTGLKRMNGEYFMWMDSDDILLSRNISVKMDYLNEHPDTEFVMAQEELVDSSDLDTTLRITKRDHSGPEDRLFEDMLNGHNVVFGPGTVLVKTESFCRAVPDLEIYESREGQNWQLMLPLIYTCKWGYVDEVVIKCVRYSNSHSRAQRTSLEQIERNEGIRELICETLRRIPAMSQGEKDRWIGYITKKYTRGSLYKAYEMKDSRRIKEFKNRLKACNAFTFRATKVGYMLYKAIKKLRG